MTNNVFGGTLNLALSIYPCTSLPCQKAAPIALIELGHLQQRWELPDWSVPPVFAAFTVEVCTFPALNFARISLR